MTSIKRKKQANRVLEELEERLSQGTTVLQKALDKLQPRKGRGGVRPGAGRPTKGEFPASERVIFRLTPQQTALLEKSSLAGESQNQTARRVLLESLEKVI